MKTTIYTIFIIITIAACGKEKPFMETCYQSEEGAMVCLYQDGRFMFMHDYTTERGKYDYDSNQIHFTRTVFEDKPLYDDKFEDFSCDYNKDGEDLLMKCNKSGHQTIRDGYYVTIEITPDNTEVRFNFRQGEKK